MNMRRWFFSHASLSPLSGSCRSIATLFSAPGLGLRPPAQHAAMPRETADPVQAASTTDPALSLTVGLYERAYIDWRRVDICIARGKKRSSRRSGTLLQVQKAKLTDVVPLASESSNACTKVKSKDLVGMLPVVAPKTVSKGEKTVRRSAGH